MRKKRQRGKPSSTAYRAPLHVREITPTEIQRRLSSRLKQIIGPGQRVSLTEAARLTGINSRTLKSYVDGSACPNVARYGRLLRVFGPEVGIEMAQMLGWEPRAANPHRPHTEDLRELRNAVAQAIQAIDQLTAHSRS